VINLFGARRCVHRIECIIRPIDGDQPANQYDQPWIHVYRRKPTPN